MPSNSAPVDTTDGLHTGRRRLSNLDLLARVGIVILALWLAINCALTIGRIVRDYNPLPVWDYWRMVMHLPQYHAYDFSIFWQQHNEHRVLFPELIWALDTVRLGAHQYLPLVVSFLCYTATWLLLVRSFAKDAEISRRLSIAGALITGAMIFWQGSSVSLGVAFLLNWTMVQCASTLALYLLARGGSQPRKAILAGTIAAAVIANFSSGNGMVIWPVLIAGALCLRMRRRSLIILCVAAVLSVRLYFVAYQSLHPLNLMYLVEHEFYTAGFILSYLSMPIGAWDPPESALRFGLLNFVLFALSFYIAWRKKLIATIPGVVLFGSFVYTLGTATMTAAGRMNADDPNFQAALADRYVSLPLMNWAALVLVLLWLSVRSRWRIFKPALLIVITAICVFLSTRALLPWIQRSGTFDADNQVAILAVENGLSDPEFDGRLFIDPKIVGLLLPYLKQDHLAIYSGGGPISWLGQRAWDRFTRCDKPQAGEVLAAHPVLGGIEVSGKIPEAWGKTRLVFVDEADRIVGIGERTMAGVPTVLISAGMHRSQPWVGFINASYGSKRFATYIVRGRSLCPLGGPHDILAPPAVTLAQVGDVIPNVQWTGTGWKKDMLPAGLVLPNPTGTSFFSSWDHADRSTGELRSSEIQAPENHCLILPIVHGPSVGGLSVEIVDAQSWGEVRLDPTTTEWQFLRLQLRPEMKQFSIVLRDQGIGWGQWLAIASPRLCK